MAGSVIDSSAPVAAPGVSMVERVIAEIRREIIFGELEPGRELSLRRLSTRLGVSFIPVREALRALESEGLLENRHGRSAQVSPLDGEEPKVLAQLRRQIEPDLAVRAAARSSRGELERLEEALEVLSRPELSPIERYDRRHAWGIALIAPAASSWDLRILERVWRATERYVRIGEAADPVARPAAWDLGPERVLLAAYRTADAERIRSAGRAMITEAERAAQRGWAAHLRRVEEEEVAGRLAGDGGDGVGEAVPLPLSRS